MSEPNTTAEVDALDELLDTEGWELVEQRLILQLAREQHTLEGDLDGDQTAKTRGKIAMIRMFLELPRAMRDEIKGQLAK